MSWRKDASRDFHFERPGTPCNVGPGSYNLNEQQSSRRPQSACFKNRESRVIFSQGKGKSPAPGQYNTEKTDKKIKKSSPFRTDSTRTVLINPANNPSPCDHSNLTDWVPKARRKPQEYFLDRPVSPNVGQDVAGFIIQQDGSIKPKKRKVKDASWLGPGCYDVHIDIGRPSSRSHSMKESYRTNSWTHKSDVPGPGQYDVTEAVTVTRPHGVKRYSEPRKVGKAKEEGAPKGGELMNEPWVKLESKMSSSMFMSRSKRDLWKKGEPVPPPTKYQTTDRARPESAKAAFGQRTPRFDYHDDTGVPGPGQYNPDRHQWTKEGPPTARRAIDIERIGNGVPGPGSYEPHENEWELYKKKPPNPVFASTVKRDRGDETITPGPGEYSPKFAPRSTSKVSIHASRSKRVNNFMSLPTKENPSPNQYQSQEDRHIGHKGRTISRNGRFERSYNDGIPGPGSYGIKHATLVKKSYNSELLGIANEQ